MEHDAAQQQGDHADGEEDHGVDMGVAHQGFRDDPIDRHDQARRTCKRPVEVSVSVRTRLK